MYAKIISVAPNSPDTFFEFKEVKRAIIPPNKVTMIHFEWLGAALIIDP